MILKKWDVLVIGSGAAGLYAAVSAAMNKKDGQKIAILTNNELASGGCSRRTHGINAAMSSTDSILNHVNDTMNAGGNLNEKKLVEILCNDIIERIIELEKWGVRFHRNTDGGYITGTYGGSSQGRSLHWYDITGLEVVQELMKKVILLGVHTQEERWVLNLIIQDGRCYGVIAVNNLTSELEIHLSKSTIMATGGGACVYPISSISSDKNATGINLAYAAGADLIDMEMVQFHPTGLLIPGSKGNGALLEEEMRMQGGILKNNSGKRYMDSYDDRGEKATRDIVARSSYLEIMAGRGTSNGGVFFDLESITTKFIAERFPHTVSRLRTWGVDLLKSKTIEISPTAHFLMGGIRIDTRCQSTINGLYACGEDAGGIHGANRIGGNGVAGALVFGCLAGKEAVCDSYSQRELPDKIFKDTTIEQLSISDKGYTEYETEIYNIMWNNCGVVRNQNDLKAAQQNLTTINEQIVNRIDSVSVMGTNKFDKKYLQGVFLLNKIRLSSLIVRSALNRDDSVGAFYLSENTKQGDVLYNIIINTAGVKRVLK